MLYIAKSKGFTLLELMITIAIIGILAAIAIPSYLNYTRRAYYSEVVRATAPYKVGVTECFNDLGTLSGCNAGSNNIPDAIAAATGAVATLSVADGVITVAPVERNGIVTADDYILTPVPTNGTLIWGATGGAVTAGYAK